MKPNLHPAWKLAPEERAVKEFQLRTVCPDDGKYAQKDLVGYLSAEAEWRACVKVQRALLATRVDFGAEATAADLKALDDAMANIDILNIAELETKVTKHDQLAVLAEIERVTNGRVASLLHPGTTSYDILDTARSYLLKKVWNEKMRQLVASVIEKMIGIAGELTTPGEDGTIRAIQVWRTHFQHTSPVPFGATIAGYAARIADRMSKCDASFNGLKWKVSGIVGTQASVATVIGKERAMEFEEKTLARLWLTPDLTATQIVQKEWLADVGNSIVTLMGVLADFANDMRMLYSSEIQEVTSMDAEKRLGGSSADAGKNNPINWENIAGKFAVVESGMRVLYAMITTDFQRDLRWSVQARYQPNMMIAETYESFARALKELDQLTVREEKMEANLTWVRNSPTEALVAILRKYAWAHAEHGVGHDFVKKMAQKSRWEWKPLIEICRRDNEFQTLWDTKFTDEEKAVLDWKIELYIGTSIERTKANIAFARARIAAQATAIIA